MNNEKKLFNRNKWCYSLGGLRDVHYQFVSMFLLVYIQYTMTLTDAQFAAIGVIMTLCKVWDAINDPMMGTIIENAHLKSGKFRPWIIIGALASGVITVLMFLVRAFTGWGFVAFFGVLYLFWGMTFTMNDVSYWSMLPALSNDADERNTLTTLMNIFISIAAFAIAAVVPMYTGTDKIRRYGICAVIVIGIFVAAQALTFFGVKEKPRDLSTKAEKVTLGKMFSIIKGNDQLLWVTLAVCCYYLGSGLLLQFGMNFCYFEFGYAEGGSVYMVFAVVYLVATLASQLTFTPLVNKLGRHKLIGLGTLISIVGYIVFMMFGYVFPKSLIFIIIAGTCIFGGQNYMYLALLVQMTNTIEYNELKTGSRNEAIVFSLRSFLAKLTSALQTLIVTGVLIVSGIKVSTDKIAALEDLSNRGEMVAEEVTSQAEQIILATPDSARLILRICMVAVPIVLIALTYIVIKKKYTITEEKYDEILKELEQRKEEN